MNGIAAVVTTAGSAPSPLNRKKSSISSTNVPQSRSEPRKQNDQHLPVAGEAGKSTPKTREGASQNASNSATGFPETQSRGIATTLPTSSSSDSGIKKLNLLADLVRTEKQYVDLLAGTIRTVASAWSRSNLPPPELDRMFRGIESIYKANRSIWQRLKEIEANPSSPQTLGDLLMKLIDDLETPYTDYYTKFLTGFDAWEAIQSNPRVRTILAMFSSSNPPPLPESSPEHPPEPPLWTLDRLFLLPRERLDYYRRMYFRLLKSTVPGKSDHRSLSAALEKIEKLLATQEKRVAIVVNQEQSDAVKITPMPLGNKSLGDPRSKPQQPSSGNLQPPSKQISLARDNKTLASSPSGRELEVKSTTGHRISPSQLPMTVTDLESCVSTERTVDLFTMKAKHVRLQLLPPTLSFSREVRCSGEVVIRFVPQSTGVETIHEKGHIFVLTDLVLICEEMEPHEQHQRGHHGSGMWLLYPPLTGRHLRAKSVSNPSNALTITVMKKETLLLEASSLESRDQLLANLEQCFEAATAALSPPKNQPPDLAHPPSSTGMELPSTSHARHQSTSNETEPSGYQRSSSRMRSSSAVSSHSADRYHGGPIVPSAAPVSKDANPVTRSPSRPKQSSPSQPRLAYPARSSSKSTSQAGRVAQDTGQLARAPSFSPGQVVPIDSFFPSQRPIPQTYVPVFMMPPQSADQGQGYKTAGHQQRPSLGVAHDASHGQTKTAREPSRPRNVPVQDTSSSGTLPTRILAENPGMHHTTAPEGHAPTVDRRGRSSAGSANTLLHKSNSSRSLRAQHSDTPAVSVPPMPSYPGDQPRAQPSFLARARSTSSFHSHSSQLRPPSRPSMPSAYPSTQSVSTLVSFQAPSPPESLVEEMHVPAAPTTTSITEQMKCKVFLQQHHEQWKALGTAKLKLYRESPTNVKQLVVVSENKDKPVLVSTIVLADGVERVGKTGVAVEVSDRGKRTGMIYMIQVRDEKSAGTLFDKLLVGSDRASVRVRG
ncbi:uncharacterized protein FIBRA_07379 [Fibroporia radiculosa]|uniref:DH domain-containing protein n=1 Tax=Fibroporia radiculosa TaxID=599839 RepID=J4GUU0_9APHY|nr:uncharacterized protein FIBRA_07379 [Fibroporia radiculosa]CCM05170.1 predicted protein [Fibroporia radiculosa]